MQHAHTHCASASGTTANHRTKIKHPSSATHNQSINHVPPDASHTFITHQLAAPPSSIHHTHTNQFARSNMSSIHHVQRMHPPSDRYAPTTLPLRNILRPPRMHRPLLRDRLGPPPDTLQAFWQHPQHMSTKSLAAPRRSASLPPPHTATQRLTMRCRAPPEVVL